MCRWVLCSPLRWLYYEYCSSSAPKPFGWWIWAVPWRLLFQRILLPAEKRGIVLLSLHRRGGNEVYRKWADCNARLFGGALSSLTCAVPIHRWGHFLAINLSTKEVLLYEINIRTIRRCIHNARWLPFAQSYCTRRRWTPITKNTTNIPLFMPLFTTNIENEAFFRNRITLLANLETVFRLRQRLHRWSLLRGGSP